MNYDNPYPQTVIITIITITNRKGQAAGRGAERELR